MSEWSNLPNARHIDWVIQSMRTNHEHWPTNKSGTWDMAWNMAWEEVYIAVYAMERSAISDAALKMVLKVAPLPFDVAMASGSVMALIAHDDCEQYWNMASDQLQSWATLTEQSQAVLLLPAVIARERIAARDSA
jgi:hypothetical protein